MASAGDRKTPAANSIPDQVEQTIEADLQRSISDLPADKRAMIVSTVKEVVEHHSGPLPHPQTLASYDRVVPGLAERIVSMTESELSHQQEMQRRALSAEVVERRIGQISAAVVTLTALGVSGWIATSGYPWVAGDWAE